MSNKQHQDYKE